MRFIFKKLLSVSHQGIVYSRSSFTKTNCRFFSASDTNVKENSSNEEKISKILKVAIVGLPNVGKSTLINQIVGRNVCATSRKVHTTRCCARAVINDNNTQLIFLDTPGVVSAKEGLKYHLERSCLVDTENAIKEADVIGILHDVSNKYTIFKLDQKILRLLYFYSQKHSFLILNKIDAIKNRRDLLECSRILTKHDKTCKSEHHLILNQKLDEITLKEMLSNEVGWAYFNDVFMVSALTGDGVGDIQFYLTNLARPGKWIFPEKLITDQKDIKIIEDIIFSKLLDHVPYEVPYNVKTRIELFEIGDDGFIRIVINLIARTERIKWFLKGKNGNTIRKIAENVEQSLKQYFLNDVRVKLIIQNSGYDSSKSLSAHDQEKLLNLA